MASIDHRPLKDGTTRPRVKWREGGGRHGDPQTYTFDTETEAERFKRLVDAAGNRMPSREQLRAFGFGWLCDDGLTDASERPATVTQLLEHYVRYKETLTEGPSEHTLTMYRQYIRNHVSPHRFGDLDPTRCPRADAREWQNELLAKPTLSPTTVLKIRGLASAAFKWAGLPGEHGEPPLRTAPSPFAGLEAPTPNVTRQPILETADEVSIFIRSAYEVDPDWADMIVVELAGGLRFGEVTALTPTVVDHTRKGVWIDQVYSRGKLHKGAKSAAGERFIPLANVAMAIISRRADGRQPQSLLFTGPHGTRWSFSTYRLRWLAVRELLAERGIAKKLKGHGLRHAFVSTLRNQGVDPKLVKIATGHKKLAMTDHYTDLTPTGRAAITTTMDGLIGAVPDAVADHARTMDPAVRGQLRERCVSAYQSGERVLAIAAEMGVSDTTVYRLLREARVEMAPPGPRPQATTTEGTAA